MGIAKMKRALLVVFALCSLAVKDVSAGPTPVSQTNGTGGRQGNTCQMICKNGNKPQGTSGRQVNIGQVNCQNGKCVWNTRNRKTNDEMESWQLRFMNGTTVHGAGVPPEIWVRQPAEEKKETKETNIPH